MNLGFKCEVETHFPTKYPEIEGWNEDIVETAGFVPLEVRFKQMEQAGIQAQFLESEFGSKDFRDMYLNHPEFDLTPEDDIEDAYEKMQLRAAWINKVKAAAKSRAEAEKTQTVPSENNDLKKGAKAPEEKD